MDYESFPFKCKSCHEYGHFAKNYPHNKLNPLEERAREKWKKTKRKKVAGKVVIQQHTPIQEGSSYSPSHLNPNSPKRRESNKNKYATLENLEENNKGARETHVEKEGDNKANSSYIDKSRKSQAMSKPTSGDPTPSKIPTCPTSRIPKILEEGNQEGS